jgi:hypothetical protein
MRSYPRGVIAGGCHHRARAFFPGTAPTSDADERRSLVTQDSGIFAMRLALSSLIFTLIVMIVPAHALGQAPPLPDAQWTDEAKIELARAFVGEAGWKARHDHAAIAWVLLKRWQAIQKRFAHISFLDVVRRYCSPLKVDSERARWVQALPWGTLDGRLARFSRFWADTRKLAYDWGEGWVPDPCPAATYWGGTMDSPSARMRPVNCGRTRNVFYSLRRSP